MILEAPAYFKNLDLVWSSTNAIISISEISRRVRMTSAFISSVSLAIKRRAELMFALCSTSSSEGSPGEQDNFDKLFWQYSQSVR